MDQRSRLDYLTVLLRKINISISISIGSNHRQETQFIQNYPSTRNKSIYPPAFDELNELINELSEEYQLNCIRSILHDYPITMIVGAFDADNNSGNEPGVNGSILPITATDHIVENVHNGMRVSQQQHKNSTQKH
ncbi:MAG: hypothetical protein AAF959_21130 [Cyanobacteria bacterium P01_D01_bin.56]